MERAAPLPCVRSASVIISNNRTCFGAVKQNGRSMFLHLPAIFGYKSWQKFILAYYQRQSVVLLFDMCVISVAVCRGQIMQDSHEITEKTYTGGKKTSVLQILCGFFLKTLTFQNMDAKHAI